MKEEDLFATALAQAAGKDRAEYLRQVCIGDDALRERLERLLALHEQNLSFLDSPPSDVVRAAIPVMPTSEDTSNPETVSFSGDSFPVTLAYSEPANSGTKAGGGLVIGGRYVLEEKLGEGGMGEVWTARQTEPIKRQVALKLIKTGMDSKGVLARFDAERQALALMDHPNIARIYDGGITPAGQPFFVMELVNGVPLTEYCDSKRLTVDARLQLFVAVCQAVQHAHQKGIIHRDLKPGNVLVTEVDGRPTPKVIDFGVAKATEQKLTDQSYSDTGAIVGTPAYMSPEQADPSSMDIDTRTDVYALGVMLYELLTGSPPIDSKQFKRGAILEMLRMVREVEPQRPSTKLSTADALPNIAAARNIEPAKLSKLLQGELDWVVMKALEKDRDRRYETANGFAADIQRYLADEVVEARPPSRGYQLKKFFKRNKLQVIAASLIFFALVGGVVGTSWQWQRAVDALAGETAERTRVTEALRRERQTRERLLDSARRQSLQLTRLAMISEADVDKEDADKVLEDFRRLWADVLTEAGTGPEADRLRADYDLYVGTFHLNLFDKPVARDHLRRAVNYWRGRQADAPDEMRPAGDAFMRLAMSLESAWVGLNPLPLGDPDNLSGTGLAGLAGAATVVAAHYREIEASRPELEGLLRECLSVRRVVAAAGNRDDRAALADALGTAADMTFDEEARRQWAAEELEVLLALTGEDGRVTDWCARIDCRARLARQAADRQDSDQVRAIVAAAAADYEQVVKTFGSVGTHRVGLRLCMATAEVMLAVGDHKEAAASAVVYPKFDDSASGWRLAAEWLAGCSRLAAADRSAADAYARRAVDCLSKTIDRAPGRVRRIFDEAVFDPLRGRDDFKRLVAKAGPRLELAPLPRPVP